MAVGVSQLGSAFNPAHGVHANAALYGVFAPDGTVKLGGATAAQASASSSIAGANSGIDRVAASHGGATVIGGGRDALAGSSGSRTLDALRHADSFIGSAGHETYSLSGGVVHDPIFTASHLSAVTLTGLPGSDATDLHAAASFGASAHTTLMLGESTSVSVKNVTPTLGGGHFK